MSIFCAVLTGSIRELGKKLGITNEIYLKALYTRWLTENMSKEDAVFDKTSLQNLIDSDNQFEKENALNNHLNESGVLPEYEVVKNTTTNKLAGTSKGKVRLYIDNIPDKTAFFNYIRGNKQGSVTSQQNALVFQKLQEKGKGLRFFEDLIKDRKDALAFLLFHEKMRIAYNDVANYDKNDLLGENQVDIEVRATEEAIVEFLEWKKRAAEKQITSSNPTTLKQQEFYSGAASGSDTFWKEEAAKLGYKTKDYTIKSYEYLSKEGQERIDKEYREVVGILSRNALDAKSYPGKLVRRDMMQADKADAIFAVGTVASNGYVAGGTGYATTRGIIRGIPVYLFDQTDNTWKVWNKEQSVFVPTSQPTLTPNAATIGTRELQDNGKEAIIAILKSGIEGTQQEGSTASEQLDIEQAEVPNNPFAGRTSAIVDFNTARAKLNHSMTPNTIDKRSKFIADQFYEVSSVMIEELCQKLENQGDYYTALEYRTSAYGRHMAMKRIDSTKLIDLVYQNFKELANRSIETMVSEGYSLERATYLKQEYQKIVDNFLPLLENAAVQIEKDSGVRISVRAVVNNKEEVVPHVIISDEKDKQDDSVEFDDNSEGEASSGNEGWSYKARNTDPHQSISLTTKNILRGIQEVDSNGEPIIDDLGNPQYLDEAFAHAILIQELSEMLNSDDFCIVTETEDGEKLYEFPALNKLTVKYPWVYHLISTLEENPNNIAAFYTDFKNFFIPYYKYSSFGTKTSLIPMNQASKVGSTITQVKRDYDSGRQLSKNSIYDTVSAPIEENIKKNQEVISEIEKELAYFDVESEADVDNISQQASDVFKSLGINISKEGVKQIILSDTNQTAFKGILSSASTILDNAMKSEAGTLVANNEGYYKEIAKVLGDVLPLENIASFRQGKKTYYSFSAPNFADSQIHAIKSDSHRLEYIRSNFSQFKFFTNDSGELREGWIKRLRDEKAVRDNLISIELKNIDGADYAEWTSREIEEAFISTYFAPGYSAEEGKINYAYYHYPIFSDSPVAKFIKMPRFTGNFKDRLLPLLAEVVKQEMWRINHVNSRKNLDTEQKIGNYDKKGSKFCFFSQLNTLQIDGVPFLQAVQSLHGDAKRQDLLIQNALRGIMEEGFNNFFNNSTFITSEIAEKAFKERNNLKSFDRKQLLEEYYWNSVYAETQIIQMTVTDLAYYKNATDFQKRYKEVYASGKRLFTNSQYGRKYENVIYLADKVKTSGTYSRFKQGLKTVLDKGLITKMDYDSILYKFKNINATDAQGFRTLDSYRAMLDMLGQWTPAMQDAVEKLREGTWDMSHFNIVWQTIKPFTFATTTKPDGLGGVMKVHHQNKDSEFLLLATMDMIAASASSPFTRALDRFMTEHNIDLALFESGCKVGNQGVIDINYDYNALEVFKREGKIVLPKTSLKNETTINLKVESWNPSLSDFDNFKNRLDELLDKGLITDAQYSMAFEDERFLGLSEDQIFNILSDRILSDEQSFYTDSSTSQNVPYNYGQTPKTGKYFNPYTVHTFSYEDKMIAQPTPEHIFDTEAIFGSQFRNLIISDLPEDFTCTLRGKTLNREETINLYNRLIINNLLDSFEEVEEEFADIHKVQKLLKSTIEGNPRYSRDLLQALEIVKIINPLTGQEEEVFNLPLYSPSITEKLQELLFSVFKNRITKQKINGGNAIMVSDIGYTQELQVVKDKEGRLVGIECYLPATSKQWIEPLMKEKVGYTETGEEYTYYELDINELPDDLRECIGYRIPTEQKYSMLPLIVKGFLPQQNGSSIMVAEEVTTLSGADFDVDKIFLMFHAFKMVHGKPQKIVPAEGTSVRDMTKAERDNTIIDLSRAILTSKSMSWVSSKPGNYDNIKRASRRAIILENLSLLQKFKEIYNISTYEELDKAFNTLSLLEDVIDNEGNVITPSLESFVSKYREELSPLELRAFQYYHNQNMTGLALVGFYANNTTMQAKYQESTLSIPNNRYITFNGKVYTNLHGVYDSNGTLISFNCAETSAASVDNGKDPVLADLMQNKQTAGLLSTLLRAGIPISEATLIFSIPSIRNSIATRGNINIEKLIKNTYKVLEEEFKITSSNWNEDYIANRTTSLTSAGLLKLTEQENSSNLSNEERKELYREKLRVYHVIKNLIELSKDINGITMVSRADSPNGAIAHTVQGTEMQKRRVELLQIKSAKAAVSGLNSCVLNNIVSYNSSREMKERVFMNSPVARLQAFYSLGIDLPIQMTSKYFFQGNPWVQKLVQKVHNHSKGGIALDEKFLSYLYKGLTYYCLSESTFFGPDDTHTFEEKRDWYVYEFPKYFSALRSKHPDLNDHPVIKRLEIREGKILLRQSSSLSETARANLSTSFTNMLFGSDLERSLVEDLFRYSFYTTGLNFGPDNFGTFFDVNFLSSFPTYLQALREMQFKINENEENGLLKNFEEQYFAIQGPAFLPSLEVDGELKEQLVVKNEEVAHKPYLSDGFEYIVMVEKSKEVASGEEDVEPERAVYRRINRDDANTTYRKIGIVYDPFTGSLRYNSRRTAKELAKDINSPETKAKAEEQKKVNFKIGGSWEFKGKLRENKNAMLNAYSTANIDMDEDMEARFAAADEYWEAISAPINAQTIEESLPQIDAFSDDSYSNPILGIENEVSEDMWAQLDSNYGQAFVGTSEIGNDFDQELPADIDSILESYSAEEGNETLDKPMCK